MSLLSRIFRKKKKSVFCSAVVVAAGSSTRMGTDKLFIEILGIPVIARTLRALQACDCINEIIVVTRPESIVPIANICRDYDIAKATKILCGGETRIESALAGLSEVNINAQLVAIHDGARPFVTCDIVQGAIDAALLHKASAPAIPVKDTVKLADNCVVVSTPDRENTHAVQTPQVFLPEIIKAALSYAFRNGLTYTDDCAAAEALGVEVHLTEGSEENIKITTPLDIKLAEAILKNRR